VNLYVDDLEHRLRIAEARLEEHGEPFGLQLVLNAIHGLTGPKTVPHPDDLAFADIEASFRAFSIESPDVDSRGFHGKSSAAMLVKTAIDLSQGPSRESASRQGAFRPAGNPV
jgi:hypothetical protein